MDLELRAILEEKVIFSLEISGNTTPSTIITKDTQVSYTIHMYLGGEHSEFLSDEITVFLTDVTKIQGHVQSQIHQIKADVKKWAIDKLFN